MRKALCLRLIALVILSMVLLLATSQAARSSNRSPAPEKSAGPDSETELGEVVLASFQSSDGNQFMLVPFLVYASYQYIGLPQEIDAIPEENARTSETRAQSILNRVKTFDVYRKGRRIGSFSVTGIVASHIGKVVCIGEATGFQPSEDDIAISTAHSQEGFWPASPLNLVRRRQLRTLALGLLPKIIPRNNVMPELSGRRVILGSVREQTAVLDLDRDGNPEVAFEISSGVKSPEGGLNAYAFVLARYKGTTQGMSKLLASAVITQGELIYGKASYDFFNAVDIDGDGVAEVILLKGYGEVGDLEVFRLHGGQLQKVCVIPNWSGS